MSPELCSTIANYIERNRLANYLFPDDIESGLGKFIIDTNKKIGIDSGINGIRHMKVSEFLQKPDITAATRLDFSREIFHSASTQQKYRREYLDNVKK